MSREAYRAYAASAPDIATISVPEDQEKLTGKPRPSPGDILGILHYNALIEAKVRGIYADAMLAEEKKRFAPKEIDPLAGTANDYETGE